MAHISVALAVYNGERFLEQQLISILNQELLPFEIVIVDDGSNDKSQKIVESFNYCSVKLRYYKNEQNLGPVGNFKKAIGLCTGDFIALCDQDDIWLPVKLNRLYEAVVTKNQDKPAVAFSDVTLIDSTGNIISTNLFKDIWKIKPPNYTFKLLLIDNVLIGCSCMFNKQMQVQITKMPVNGILMHDHWIALIGYSFGQYTYIADPLLLYRSHNESVTEKTPVSGIQNKIKAELQARRKYMQQNHQQAKHFKDAYLNQLSNAHRGDLDNFLTLAQGPFFIKRFYAKALKIYANKIAVNNKWLS